MGEGNAKVGCLRPGDGLVYLALKVQARAARNELGEITGSELKVRIAAPPVESAANKALLEFLAERLGCSRNRLELVRGRASRHKLVAVYGMDLEVIQARLLQTARTGFRLKQG